MKLASFLFLLLLLINVACDTPTGTGSQADTTPEPLPTSELSLEDKVSNFNIYYVRPEVRDSLVTGLEKAADVLRDMEQTPVFVVGVNPSVDNEVYLYTVFEGNDPYPSEQGIEEIVEQNRSYIDSVRTYTIPSVQGKVKF